ncbi:MAG: hypothetical protein ACOYYJ_17570 [Chloroflexota bacterium]
MYEGEDLNYDEAEAPPEESSNRTFLIVAGILGGIVLLSIICVAVIVLVYLPQRASQDDAQGAAQTQQAAINEALTLTAVSFELSLTPQASTTPLPTETLVVAQPSATSTQFTSTPDPATATVIAGLTQVAGSTTTVFPTSTALPTSGFADEVGLPGLVVAALALVAVIFLARRLRVTPTR